MNRKLHTCGEGAAYVDSGRGEGSATAEYGILCDVALPGAESGSGFALVIVHLGL